MNILIIGLGCAGGRFLEAANQLQAEENDLPPISLAYVAQKIKILKYLIFPILRRR